MEKNNIEKTIKLYKGSVELKFITDYADKHEYYLNGKRLYGVTYYTGIIDKSEALKSWAVNQMGLFLLGHIEKPITEELIFRAKKEYRNVSKEAMDIGKQIHKWIELKISGKNPPIPEDERVKNGAIAFMDYQKNNNVKWIESERLIYSKKYKYPGTADGIGKIGKDLVLFDFKSSKPSSISPDGIYPEHAIQTAGYQIAYEEETGKKIDYRVIITLNKETGEFKFRKFDDNKKDKDAFINCLNLRRRLVELK
jgi:CRISPR/Cas system-associated exonuclease Cas4 (RecB family)